MKYFAVFALSVIAAVFCAPSLHAAEIELKLPVSAQIGQPFVAEITAPPYVSNPKVSWLGKETVLLPAPKSGYDLYRVILGTDLKNVSPGEHALTFTCGVRGKTLEVKKNIILQKKDYPAEKLTVPPKMVNPPKEQMERIDREAKLGSAAIQTNTPGFAPPLPLSRPVPGVTTSVYGKSRYFNNELRSRHAGADLRAAVGTPVKAAAKGTVVLTGDFWFAGNCVYIDHGAGLVSFYGHLSKIQAEKGMAVKAGDVIGLSGQTGRVTGPHLHFGLAWRGEYFDPMPLLPK